MVCFTHISTSSELEIASNISQVETKRFLETRYDMRYALLALFKINFKKSPQLLIKGNHQNY
tara:strand:- start:428 stop:613 length:186 start_codon:yes stop_codon:yes gene_type:complete